MLVAIERRSRDPRAHEAFVVPSLQTPSLESETEKTNENQQILMLAADGKRLAFALSSGPFRT
jgi:hypothetical protein